MQPYRAHALAGEAPSQALFERVQRLVSADDGLESDSDIHASAFYRKEVAGVMARRALKATFERARPYQSCPPS